MSYAKFETVKDEIVALVQKGVGIDRAAEIAGASRESCRLWRRRGEADLKAGEQTEFAEFARQVNGHRAQAAGLMERSILSAASKDWRAGAWYLERQLPGEYGRKDQLKVEIDGALQTMINDVQPLMSPAAFGELIQALAEIHGIELEQVPSGEGENRVN